MGNVKTCRICGETKPLEDFPQRKDTKDGRRNDCRDCNIRRQRQYRVDTIEERTAFDRARYAANREKVIQDRRAFRAGERDRINAERRRRRQASPEKYRAQQRASYLNNREVIMARVLSRKFRRRKVKLEKLIARDGLICGICGRALESLATSDVDHILPRSLGGSNDLSNLQLSHAGCNRSKQALRDHPLQVCRA